MHYFAYTSPRDERTFKWGDVTYSDVNEAKKARKFLHDMHQSVDSLTSNVSSIQLKPIRVETGASQTSCQPSGVKVLVSWFPFPAREIAYIKCDNRGTAAVIVDNLNKELLTRLSKTFLKKSGDIAIPVLTTDDEFTVRERLECCCTAIELEGVQKITVPSKLSPQGAVQGFGGHCLENVQSIDIETEKAELATALKDYGSSKVLNAWVANCQKVRACVLFESLASAEKVIRDLNGLVGKLGVRRVYLELENKREIVCDGRIYEKIRKNLEAMKCDGVDIEVESRQKRKKILVTGDDIQVSC